MITDLAKSLSFDVLANRMPIYPIQLWLSLAALCVIDKEHAEALSSGQWLGKDGRPKSKVCLFSNSLGQLNLL